MYNRLNFGYIFRLFEAVSRQKAVQSSTSQVIFAEYLHFYEYRVWFRTKKRKLITQPAEELKDIYVMVEI